MDVARFLKKPTASFFLLGPRGTGKSWWTRKSFSGALIVDLLDAGTLRELAARRIYMINELQLDQGQAEFVQSYFDSTVLPELEPILLSLLQI